MPFEVTILLRVLCKTSFPSSRPMETELPLQPMSVWKLVHTHIYISTKEYFPVQPKFSQQTSRNLT